MASTIFTIGFVAFVLTVLSVAAWSCVRILHRMGLSGWWLLLAGFWPIMLPILATCRWPSLDKDGDMQTAGMGQIFMIFGGIGLIALALITIAYFGFDVPIYDENTGEPANPDSILALIIQLAIVVGGIFALGTFVRWRDRKRSTL